MKGDFVEIVYRQPQGLALKKLQATRDGASVATKMPDRGELFIRVEVLNKAGDPTETSRFLATEVLAISEGHEKITRTKRK